MKNTSPALRRQSIIDDLKESMRAAQRRALKNPRRKPRRRAYIEKRPAQIGVWKGGN